MSKYLAVAMALVAAIVCATAEARQPRGAVGVGARAVKNVATVYDLWATVLHQLGIDHEDLTFRHGGRDMRLTDVHGNVMKKIIA
jgi:predicted amidohydrolase